jgi:amino acid permease
MEIQIDIKRAIKKINERQRMVDLNARIRRNESTGGLFIIVTFLVACVLAVCPLAIAAIFLPFHMELSPIPIFLSSIFLLFIFIFIYSIIHVLRKNRKHRKIERWDFISAALDKAAEMLAQKGPDHVIEHLDQIIIRKNTIVRLSRINNFGYRKLKEEVATFTWVVNSIILKQV